MSIDKSLKSPGGIQRSRNVLKRGERIDQLIEEGRWQEGQSALGLPKVLVQRAVAGKKKKKKQEEDEEEQETTET
ncbi:MAG: small basic protein [Fuerstiella sp.]|nr:small basic protein [Fuerstiella sp.]